MRNTSKITHRDAGHLGVWMSSLLQQEPATQGDRIATNSPTWHLVGMVRKRAHHRTKRRAGSGDTLRSKAKKQTLKGGGCSRRNPSGARSVQHYGARAHAEPAHILCAERPPNTSQPQATDACSQPIPPLRQSRARHACASPAYQGKQVATAGCTVQPDTVPTQASDARSAPWSPHCHLEEGQCSRLSGDQCIAIWFNAATSEGGGRCMACGRRWEQRPRRQQARSLRAMRNSEALWRAESGEHGICGRFGRCWPGRAPEAFCAQPRARQDDAQ